ncbi:hypothetical protein AAMO2058_001149100 [Amorphochlora amoebiformis]
MSFRDIAPAIVGGRTSGSKCNSRKILDQELKEGDILPNFSLPKPIRTPAVVTIKKCHPPPRRQESNYLDFPKDNLAYTQCQLISWKDGSFRVTAEAIEALEALQASRLHVICIAGPYRTGKSYLLNRLLNAPSRKGFRVGGSVNACTKGIWMAVVPPEQPDNENTPPAGSREGLTKDELNKDKATIFLDSEGLGATEKDQEFDAHMFALCTLLSSTLILNTTGCISNGTIEQLELVVNIANHIQATSEGKRAAQDGSREDIFRHLPNMIWVLRDFTLALEDKDGKPLTPNEYLDNALRPIKAGCRGSSKNDIRSAICSAFRKRECMILVRPIQDEVKLRRLEDIPTHRLRGMFRKQINELKEKVMASVQPKMVNGHYLTGSAFVHLAQVYVKGLNTGSLPPIRSAWKSVIEIQARHALEKAIAVYEQLNPSATPDGKNVIKDSELARRHISARQRAFDIMMCVALGTPKTLLRKLDDQIDKIWVQRQNTNHAISTQLCLSAAKRVFRDMGLDNSRGMSQLSWGERRDAAVATYLNLAKGSAKEEVGWRFFREKDTERGKRLTEEFSQLRKSKLMLAAEVEQLSDSLSKARKRLDESDVNWRENLRDKQTAWAEERRALMDEVQRLLLQLQGGGIPASRSGTITKGSLTSDGRKCSDFSDDQHTKLSIPGAAIFEEEKKKFIISAATRKIGKMPVPYALSLLEAHAREKGEGVDIIHARTLFWSAIDVFSGKSFIDWLIAKKWANGRPLALYIASLLVADGRIIVKRGKTGKFEDSQKKYYQFVKVGQSLAVTSTIKSMSCTSLPGTEIRKERPYPPPMNILHGVRLPVAQIRKELEERKGTSGEYKFDDYEEPVFLYINSTNPERATQRLSRNVTKHCMMITTLSFLKMEAGKISQSFRIADVSSAYYLGYSRSGFAKVQVQTG